MPPDRTDDGLRAAMELRRRLPGTGVLILLQFCEPAYVLELVGEGHAGVGYLLKERVGDVATFVDAVHGSRRGQRAGPRGCRPDARPAPPDEPLRPLTPRERDVLAAMAEGRSNRGSREALFISLASVEKHVTRSSASCLSRLRTPSIAASRPS